MRVLLTRLSALGDIVHTWPLAQVLGQRGELFWLVEERFLPLVAYHPQVRGVLPLATKSWRKTPWGSASRQQVAAVLGQLRRLGLEAAVDPQGLVKSAIWPALAKIPRRLGLARAHRRERVAGLFYTETVNPPQEACHVVDFNLALGQALGIPVTYGCCPDGSFLKPHLPPPPPEAFAVLLFPATGQLHKTWPPEAFAALARRLLREGLPVTVMWGPGERAAAQAVVDLAPGARIGPPTDLLQLASCLAHAHGAIGGDTGPIHLAAALGTRTVGLFLATDPVRNAPRGPAVGIVRGASSGARRGKATTQPIRQVPPEEVAEAFWRLLSQPV
ncbi:MAG: lipopolysaccharide heptosyltransferase I [Thermoanaerobaculum sp.]|nr:lipopolysaccharide heptosyltransferase I [Thermoanaerobaculum sp.]MDW7968405.1 lipopolysaccharide heptosyltransferase I [Thermoanaerobaculum sp.]